MPSNSQNEYPPDIETSNKNENEKIEDNEKINLNSNNNNNNGNFEEEVEKQNVDSDYQISPEEPLTPIDERENDNNNNNSEVDLRKDEGIEVTTQRSNENVIDSDNGPTPIGTSEIIKLENEVDKTIENANNVGDVPPLPKQQDDKILDEFVENMISNAPNQEATTSNEIISTLLVTSTSTEANHNRHHHQIQHTPETVTSESVEEFQAPTVDIEIPFDVYTAPTTTSFAPEAETIFTAINNNTHNGHINVFIDEKLPIVKLLNEGIVPSTPSVATTTTVATTIDKELIMVSLLDDCAAAAAVMFFFYCWGPVIKVIIINCVKWRKRVE